MSPLVAELEWRMALARRRLLVLNVVVPLALMAPIALGAAPPFHAAAVYAVLFALFGTFGSAIPLVRDAEAGIVARVLLAGIRPSGYLIQRAGASALLDVAQLAPALVVAWVGAHASPSALIEAALALGATLWVANLLGVIVAAVARSVAEAALFAATGALLLLHVSGVFRTPPAGSLAALLEAVGPFRALHESLLAMTSGVPADGGTSLVAWAVALPAMLAVLAGPLASSLRQAYRT